MKKEKQQSDWEKELDEKRYAYTSHSGITKESYEELKSFISAQIQKAKEIKKGENWRRGYMQGYEKGQEIMLEFLKKECNKKWGKNILDFFPLKNPYYKP